LVAALAAASSIRFLKRSDAVLAFRGDPARRFDACSVRGQLARMASLRQRNLACPRVQRQ
jgi:hypothetical protein